MQSPVAAIRRSLGLSQERFAAMLGMSRQALIRYEQATLPTPSDKFKTAVGALYGPANPNPSHPTVLEDEETVLATEWYSFLDDYREFQKYRRQQSFASDLLNSDVDFIPEHLSTLSKTVNPFSAWRYASAHTPIHPVPTLTAVAVGFCIHIPTLQSLEPNNPTQQPAQIPKSVLSALKEAGYSSDILQALRSAWEVHRWYLEESDLTNVV